MKKILLFSFLCCITGLSYAQSLEDINGLIGKKQYAEAKAAIDKYIADPKNVSSYESWYFKGFIYNAYSKEPGVSKADAYAYKLAAFDAFKKNQALDRLDLMMKTEFYYSYLDLYQSLYDMGAGQFNDKDYAGALRSFMRAQEIENYILSKNYTYKELALSKTDTALIMNMGASALLGKDSAAAVSNYRKLTDIGIVGKDYEQIYEFLVGYYSDRNDKTNLQPMLAKAKAAYPKNNYWNALELEKLAAGGDKTALFARYEELYKTDPSNFTNSYNYAVEIYNSLYGKDVTSPDPAMEARLTDVLKTTIAIDKGIDATALMANHLFNWAADHSTKAALIKDGKGAKPEDLKKKKDLNILAVAKMDETIPYAEQVKKYYADKATLTVKEKLNYQLVLGYLSDIYVAKANPKKAAEYDRVRDSIKF
ncbi:MAG: hypothetical protein WKF88_08575 [Ferruginibacter sp.]